MPRYDPAGHPELSAEALALTPEQLDSKADRAEELLGIAETAFEGRPAERLRLAVALQVNRLLRLDELGDVVQESKGDQSFTYARPKDGSERDPLDPEAARIVAAVLAEEAPATVPLTSTSTPHVFVW